MTKLTTLIQQEVWHEFVGMCIAQTTSMWGSTEKAVVAANEQIEQLKRENEKLIEDKKKVELERDEHLAFFVAMGAVMNDSQGVAGWHLNGDVATWEEFDFTLEHCTTAKKQYALEQQAECIEDFITSKESETNWYLASDDELDLMASLQSRVKYLRSQVNALKQ